MTVLRLRFALLFSLYAIFALAQEQLGVRLENYAGANGTSLNPTRSLDYPLQWNLNLVGVGFFLDNSYGYVSRSKVSSLVKNEQAVDFGPNYKNNKPQNVPLADFYDNKRTTFLFQNTTINGPALSVKIGKDHAFGLFYNARFNFSVANIPNELQFYTLDAKGFNQDFSITKFGGAVMAWDEIGLNYAFRKETNDGFWQLGTNLKYLRGKEAFFAKVNDDFLLARRLGDSLKITLPSVSYGFTRGNFDNVKNNTYQLQNFGRGLGLDIGFSYLVENNDYEDYSMRFGAAILDIGSVKFANQSEEHLINFQNSNILDVNAFKKVEDPSEAVKLLSYQLKGDSLKTKVGEQFSIGLPTALCLQFDYQFFPHAFANATWIQRLPYQPVGLRRGNLFALSARYEHRWFSATLPIQLYEYQRVRIGFAARVAFLTIGTDYIGSFLRKGNFTGSDVYFAIKLNPLNLGWGSPNWLQGGFKKRGKSVKCYQF